MLKFMQNRTVVWILVLLLSLVFLGVDLSLPRGVSVGVFYVLVVLVALSLPTRQEVFLAALLGSLLTLIGFLFSGTASELWIVLANRLLALFVVWCVALAGVWYKQTRLALRRSEAEMSAVFQTAAVGIILVDDDGHVRAANQACQDLFGVSPAAMGGQPFVHFISPVKSRGVVPPPHSTVRTGQATLLGLNQEFVGRRQDGSMFPVTVSLSKTRIGGTGTVAAIVQDMSELQAAQDSLRQSEERFRLAVEASPVAIVIIDVQGVIQLVNTETERLFGYGRQELYNRPVESLVPERFRDHHPIHRAAFFADPQTRVMGEGRELYGRRKDGSEFAIEIGLNPLETHQGLFVLSAIVDITERRRAEEEIKRVNQELQRKNEEMEQFVYTVSHDLKSPLVTCKGFVGALKEDAAEGRHQEMGESIERIERAADRMGELIDDLLHLSRLGSVRNEPEQIDVGQLVQSIRDDLGDRLERAGAMLHVAQQLPRVTADRVQLREVFENLISNAIKYGCPAPGGRIDVGGAAYSGGVRFFVQDDGPGVPAEFQTKIFGVFQRLPSEQEGAGVGLAAVARIMERHGGRSWVESDSGRGATFWLEFPRPTRSLARPADASPPLS